MTSDLARKFHEMMLEIYARADTECNYRPTRFLQMVTESGGLTTARSLLRTNKPSEGLMRLWELNRLDLSLEALVISEPWSALFTEQEISGARKRLNQLGYKARENHSD